MYDISTTERDYEALEAWPASVPLNACINCSRTLFHANFFFAARKHKRRYPAALTERISGKWPSAAQRCAETVWVALRAGAVMMECRELYAWERQHNNCVGRRPAEVIDKGP